MPLPSVRISEEVARFAFEVYVDYYLESEIYVSFANPTAGPWKTVKMRDPQTHQMQEIHRFGKEEKRPDLAIVSASLCTTAVIEAKAVVGDLLSDTQIAKAREACEGFAGVLTRSRHPLLQAGYHVVPGFLWATSDFAREVRDCHAALQDRWPEAAREALFVGVGNLAHEAHIHLAAGGGTAGHAARIADSLSRSPRSTSHILVFD